MQPPNKSTDRPRGVSIRNILVLAVPLIVLVLGGAGYYIRTIGQPPDGESIFRAYARGMEAPTKLDEGLVDADGDLIADPPRDPAEHIDPPTLVFMVLGSDSEREQETWRDFTAHLAKETGRKVDVLVSARPSLAESSDLREGRLHLVVLNTGIVSNAVNRGGAVPFCLMADADGKFGYRMQILVPANSPLQKPADLRGQELTLGSYHSFSGFRAPLVTLLKEFNLKPGIDYRPAFEASSEALIRSVAEGKVTAAPAAEDLVKRLAGRGDFDLKAVRSIYESAVFPPACFAHGHRLKPELSAKIKTAFLNFRWEGTSLEKTYRPAGLTKFVPVSYQTDWAPVRALEQDAVALLSGSAKK